MIVVVACAGLVAVAIMIAAISYFREVCEHGGFRAWYAEAIGNAFPPPAPAPEIPGWPGWTREQLKDPRFGIDPVTGGPRYDKNAAGLRERGVRS